MTAMITQEVREIGVRFYRLTFSQKNELCSRFSLLEEDDVGQSDFARFRRVFIRAQEMNKLEELKCAIDAIMASEADPQHP